MAGLPIRSAWIAMLVLGCGGGTRSAAPPAPAPVANTEPAAPPGGDRKPTGAECTAAVDKAMSLIRAEPKLRSHFDDERLAEKRADSMERCAREWDGATVDCLIAATDARALDTCVRGRTHMDSASAP